LKLTAYIHLPLLYIGPNFTYSGSPSTEKQEVLSSENLVGKEEFANENMNIQIK
jgi:hypothetical protein